MTKCQCGCGKITYRNREYIYGHEPERKESKAEEIRFIKPFIRRSESDEITLEEMAEHIRESKREKERSDAFNQNPTRKILPPGVEMPTKQDIKDTPKPAISHPGISISKMLVAIALTNILTAGSLFYIFVVR